jgi:ATP-dependent Clp protease adaptor protein ClpS
MSKKKLTHSGTYQLVLFNDNHHTFDEIIEILVSYAGHSPLQAAQCAIIIHNTGKYAVLEDKYDVCYDIYQYLLEYNINMEIIKKPKYDTKN